MSMSLILDLILEFVHYILISQTIKTAWKKDIMRAFSLDYYSSYFFLDSENIENNKIT